MFQSDHPHLKAVVQYYIIYAPFHALSPPQVLLLSLLGTPLQFHYRRYLWDDTQLSLQMTMTWYGPSRREVCFRSSKNTIPHKISAPHAWHRIACVVYSLTPLPHTYSLKEAKNKKKKCKSIFEMEFSFTHSGNNSNTLLIFSYNCFKLTFKDSFSFLRQIWTGNAIKNITKRHWVMNENFVNKRYRMQKLVTIVSDRNNVTRAFIWRKQMSTTSKEVQYVNHFLPHWLFEIFYSCR